MNYSNPFQKYLLEKGVEQYRKMKRGEKVDLFEDKIYNSQSGSIQNNIYNNMNSENNTEETEKGFNVRSDKELRVSLDTQLQVLKSLPRSRERSLSITKLQEAIMWLGMDLKRLNEINPYPDSYDPSNTNINTTADGLKM